MAKKQSTKKLPESAKHPDCDTAAPETFEKSLTALELIVDQLETGKLPLGESLSSYEEGVGYLKACYAQLSSAERRIELLSGVDADGNPITQPLEDEGSLADESKGDLEKKARKRSRRRSSGASRRKTEDSATTENDVDEGDLLF